MNVWKHLSRFQCIKVPFLINEVSPSQNELEIFRESWSNSCNIASAHRGFDRTIELSTIAFDIGKKRANAREEEQREQGGYSWHSGNQNSMGVPQQQRRAR